MILPITILILGTALLGMLTARGCLYRQALDAGPDRSVGLHPADLLIGLGLMIAGSGLAAHVLPTTADKVSEADVDATAFALRVLVVQLAGQGLPVAYLLIRAGARPDGLRRIGAICTDPGRDLRWGVLGFLTVTPIVMAVIQTAVFIGLWFGVEAPTLAHPMLEKLVSSDSPAAVALIVLSAAVVAPVLEEAVFRGLIQSVMTETLGKDRRWSVVLVASFIFAMIHADFVHWDNWQTLPGLFVLGVALGWLYERSGSLWPNIVLHVLFNAMNLVLAAVSSRMLEG